jgi:hypothetical protein
LKKEGWLRDHCIFLGAKNKRVSINHALNTNRTSQHFPLILASGAARWSSELNEILHFTLNPELQIKYPW